MVAALGLAAVIDLRSRAERDATPCPRPPGFTARIVFHEDPAPDAAPHLQGGRAAPESPAAAAAAMKATYAALPFRPEMVYVLTRYFEVLADSDRPSLIHCMAGKDRTGLAVALFHEAVGVHRDDIFADYMLTNVAGRIEQRLEAGARHIRKTFGDGISDDAVRVLMSVRVDYLQSAFTAIEARHGSGAAYLRDTLGVNDRLKEAIARNFLS